ncbi:MAG: hypothetical protein Ct9H300mP1_38750 [Planctomycetaceae bacterium]|nr:MAG: hypothetical protein Ct9H300mP1_38750 [Planctomycetaceae bacterium]
MGPGPRVLLAVAACLAHSTPRARARGQRTPLPGQGPALGRPGFGAPATFSSNPQPHLVFYTLVGPGTSVLPFGRWPGWVARWPWHCWPPVWGALVRRLVSDEWAGWQQPGLPADCSDRKPVRRMGRWRLRIEGGGLWSTGMGNRLRTRSPPSPGEHPLRAGHQYPPDRRRLGARPGLSGSPPGRSIDTGCNRRHWS